MAYESKSRDKYPSFDVMRRALAAGETFCEEIAGILLTRFSERESLVHAWVFLDPELVLERARALDRASFRGPLHGVPVGIKDIIDTYDMPTQMGSSIYAGHQPTTDAACVALLRAAGALIVGKTVTAEFAGTFPGPTANPCDLSRTPGGSSSGSAAAVADGMIPIALGTQTGGSVLRPASYCGVFGFKPTQSAINRAGVKPAAERFDTVGLIAQDVEYASAFFAVLTNSGIDGVKSRKPGRVGVCTTPFWSRAQPDTVAALAACAQHLRDSGVRVDEFVLPQAFDLIGEARATINDFQRAHGLRAEWQSHPELFSVPLARVIRNGLTIPFDAFAAASQLVERCKAAFIEAVGDRDFILAPSVDGEAPVGLDSTGEHHFQSLWTTIDVPTASVPFHTSQKGMPVGVQIVARPWQDREVLQYARWLAL